MIFSILIDLNCNRTNELCEGFKLIIDNSGILFIKNGDNLTPLEKNQAKDMNFSKMGRATGSNIYTKLDRCNFNQNKKIEDEYDHPSFSLKAGEFLRFGEHISSLDGKYALTISNGKLLVIRSMSILDNSGRRDTVKPISIKQNIFNHKFRFSIPKVSNNLSDSVAVYKLYNYSQFLNKNYFLKQNSDKMPEFELYQVSEKAKNCTNVPQKNLTTNKFNKLYKNSNLKLLPNKKTNVCTLDGVKQLDSLINLLKTAELEIANKYKKLNDKLNSLKQQDKISTVEYNKLSKNLKDNIKNLEDLKKVSKKEKDYLNTLKAQSETSGLELVSDNYKYLTFSLIALILTILILVSIK